MAKKSKKTLAGEPLPGSKNFGKYDWRKLADGKVHKLIHGKHFTCKVQSFRLAASAWAKRNKLKVEIHMQEAKAPGYVTVRFFKGM